MRGTETGEGRDCSDDARYVRWHTACSTECIIITNYD